MKRGFLIFALIGVIGLSLGYFFHPTIAYKEEAAKPAVYNLSPAQFATGPLISLEEAFIQVAEEIKLSVVNLSIEKRVRGRGSHFRGFNDDFFRSPFDDLFKRFFDDFEREHKTRSLGSGVIVDERGYILTNNHVIKGADEIKVKLSDGREFAGKVRGQDSKTDLALIKIEARDRLPVARLGNSDEIKIGSWAIAIGNPFGLEHTVTVGVVSAKGRAIGAAAYEDFIQTDASINPGNSGGPLTNIKGEVIGINTAIVAGGQGIGFAIPINMAKRVLDSLITKGKVTRPWLGVVIQDITPPLARHFGVEPREGVLISEVTPNGPADDAGLRRGDVITEIDGKRVDSAHKLQREILGKRVRGRVGLLVLRDGKERMRYAVLEEMPEEGRIIGQREEVGSKLGITVQSLTPELARNFDLDPDEEGVVVVDVERGSPADLGGLRRRDLIKEINHHPIRDLKDLRKEIDKIDLQRGAVFLIKREGHQMYVSITIG